MLAEYRRYKVRMLIIGVWGILAQDLRWEWGEYIRGAF